MLDDLRRLALLAALPLLGFCQPVDDATLCEYNRMHPSNLGCEKVEKMLLPFLKTSPTSKMWVLAQAQAPQSGNAAQAEHRRKYMAEHPPRSSVGLTALTDLGTGTYKGEQGGLYPGGSNTIPAQHLKAGLEIARQIVPLDADGRPSPDGKIVMLCVGFSNPTIEFSAFKPLSDAFAGRNPSLVTINTCVGSQAAPTIADPNSGYWRTVDQRIKDAGVSPKQVQAIWMKQVIPGDGEFPAFAKRLQGYIVDSLHNAHDKFPNLKVTYLTSRTYGGWTEMGGSPEPAAYETGFAVKWVIADQIAGKPELNFDQAKGAVRSPWIEWGPYIWTDGVKGRKDGMVYLRSDTREDGLHPSDAGTKKVVAMLMDFFETDPTARIWFLKR